MLYGVDISKWQGDNFDVSQHDFIIAKATEGKTHTDELFHHNIKKALESNKLIGAYHYARPENNSAKFEAQNFVNAVSNYIGNCLLALDWEGVALSYPIDWALEWLKEVELITGVKPLLYCSASYVEQCKKISENGNGIWVAKWSNIAPLVKPTFSVLALWQYSNKPYDKNKFFGDANTWQKYCVTTKEVNIREGNCSCGCEFCDDFRVWLESHGYRKNS